MILDRIALILVIIGALDWGSVGIFNFDFIQRIFGTASTLSKIIFALVGLAGIWCISLLFRSRNEILDRDDR